MTKLKLYNVWRTTGYTLCTPCSSLPLLVIEFMHVSIIVQLILYISILPISYTVVNYINLPCSSTLVHCTFGFVAVRKCASCRIIFFHVKSVFSHKRVRIYWRYTLKFVLHLYMHVWLCTWRFKNLLAVTCNLGVWQEPGSLLQYHWCSKCVEVRVDDISSSARVTILKLQE